MYNLSDEQTEYQIEQHESIPAKLLIDNDDRGQELLADSAYVGKNVKSVMRKYQMKDRVIKRSVRGEKPVRNELILLAH